MQQFINTDRHDRRNTPLLVAKNEEVIELNNEWINTVALQMFIVIIKLCPNIPRIAQKQF